MTNYMEFEGTFSVASSSEETWDFLLDPEELSSCIPNCQDVDVVDEDHYTAKIGVEVSYVSATFDTNVEIQEKREEEYLKVYLTGNAEEGDGRMEATGEMEMEERDDGGTEIHYINTMDVAGRIMNMGSRVVKRVGQRQTNKTIDNIQERLGEVETEEAQ